MYYAMKGQIDWVRQDGIVLTVHDISYEILMAHPEKMKLHDEVTLFLYEVIREDAHDLVGFPTMEEKEVFLSLISVKGIGPKTALTALSATEAMTFVRAVEASDVKFLKKLPGIGAKAAQQIVLDLKGHLSFDEQEKKKTLLEPQLEARDALKTLGFKVSDIDRVLALCKQEDATSEEIVKQALLLLRK